MKSTNARVIGLALGLAGLLLTGALWLQPDGRVDCLVENRSSRLASIDVSIHGQSYGADGLPPGGSFHFSFVPAADAHYEVVVRFESGGGYRENVGYVTSGTTLEHRVLVGDSGVRLEAAVAAEPSDDRQ